MVFRRTELIIVGTICCHAGQGLTALATQRHLLSREEVETVITNLTDLSLNDSEVSVRWIICCRPFVDPLWCDNKTRQIPFLGIFQKEQHRWAVLNKQNGDVWPSGEGMYSGKIYHTAPTRCVSNVKPLEGKRNRRALKTFACEAIGEKGIQNREKVHRLRVGKINLFAPLHFSGDSVLNTLVEFTLLLKLFSSRTNGSRQWNHVTISEKWTSVGRTGDFVHNSFVGARKYLASHGTSVFVQFRCE